MKVDYYLNEEEKENLYCRISDGAEQVSFSMGYAVDPATWDADKGELDWEDMHYYTLRLYKKYLIEQHEQSKNEGKDKPFVQLKEEAQQLIQESGIAGIVEMMFDYNSDQDVPKYKDFIRAFEKFSKLKKSDYKVEVFDNMLRFHLNDGKAFEIDTYAGLTSRLKNCVDNHYYDDLAIASDVSIWNEIFIDLSIEKHVFMPVMLSEWELYWAKKIECFAEHFEEEKKALAMKNLEQSKNESWHRFQVFMACYDDTAEIIRFAYDLKLTEFFPLAVISMLRIFKAEDCYSEYCDLEFCEENGWDSFYINENDDDDAFDEDDDEDDDDDDFDEDNDDFDEDDDDFDEDDDDEDDDDFDDDFDDFDDERHFFYIRESEIL